MASPETKPNVCLMCLDAPAVVKLGTCDHSYCKSCHHAHIEDQLKGQHEVIACPACQGQSLPDDPKVSKVETNVASAAGGGGQVKLPVRDALQQATAGDALRQANCKLCHFKGKTVKAVNICKECRQLPLCADCSLGHRQNEATRKHVVTPIALPRDEEPCTIHDEPLVLFCTKCSKNVCHVCVCLEHIGHTIETFNNVVFTEVEKVRSVLKEEEKWLNMLKYDDFERRESKSTTQKMEDVLIKSIEDHAEKCIEEIIKNKETLKKQVRTDFEAIHKLLTKHLEAMPEFQRTSGDAVAVANRLLNEQAELHSTYVEKLVGLKEQLDKLKEGHPTYQKNKETYQKAFKDVCQKELKFYPWTPNCKIGGFQDLYGGPRCGAGCPCVCETCGRKADASRVAECREKGTCTCGTCGCVYNRIALYRFGLCCSCDRRITTPNSYQQFP